MSEDKKLRLSKSLKEVVEAYTKSWEIQRQMLKKLCSQKNSAVEAGTGVQALKSTDVSLHNRMLKVHFRHLLQMAIVDSKQRRTEAKDAPARQTDPLVAVVSDQLKQYALALMDQAGLNPDLMILNDRRNIMIASTMFVKLFHAAYNRDALTAGITKPKIAGVNGQSAIVGQSFEDAFGDDTDTLFKVGGEVVTNLHGRDLTTFLLTERTEVVNGKKVKVQREVRRNAGQSLKSLLEDIGSYLSSVPVTFVRDGETQTAEYDVIVFGTVMKILSVFSVNLKKTDVTSVTGMTSADLRGRVTQIKNAINSMAAQ